MMNHRVLALLLVGLLSCGSSITWNEPDPRFPIVLRVGLVEERSFHKDEPIHIQVDIGNRSESAILACIEDWSLNIGIVSVDLFNENRESIRVISEVHANFPISEEKHLLVLKPGEMRSGTLNVNRRSRVFDLSEGTYFIIATYHCPFKGERLVNNESVRVAFGQQRSLPVPIRIVE